MAWSISSAPENSDGCEGSTSALQHITLFCQPHWRTLKADCVCKPSETFRGQEREASILLLESVSSSGNYRKVAFNVAEDHALHYDNVDHHIFFIIVVCLRE